MFIFLTQSTRTSVVLKNGLHKKTPGLAAGGIISINSLNSLTGYYINIFTRGRGRLGGIISINSLNSLTGYSYV